MDPVALPYHNLIRREATSVLLQVVNGFHFLYSTVYTADKLLLLTSTVFPFLVIERVGSNSYAIIKRETSELCDLKIFVEERNESTSV